MLTGFFRECSNQECGFRYPDLDTGSEKAYCPKCGESAPISCRTKADQMKNNNQYNSIEIIPLLDNIRSVYNVGSMIRTCEGFGIHQIILSGISPLPDHPRMDKTGLGAIPEITWKHTNNGLKKVIELKATGYQIISLENMPSSLPIASITKSMIQARLCLVAGNENLGIDPEILRISDLVAAIPMGGKKESFNVSVAFGIAVFHLLTAASI